MNLQFIKTEKCPECGAPVCEEKVKVDFDYAKNRPHKPPAFSTHVNGGRWESREFVCGAGVEYIPNFSREMSSGKCTHSAAFDEINKKREELVQEIQKVLASSDLPENDQVRASLVHCVSLSRY